MSITPVGSGILEVLYSSAQPVRTKQPASATSDPRASGVAPASDTVTLSTNAQAMASLNARGITMVTLEGSGLSSGRQPSSPGTPYGSVSKGDFEVVASGFGASTQQADQDFALMDTDGNGLISNAEMLDAMSQTSNGNGPLAQSLRQMMDTNHDGSVSGSEFVNLETAMVSAEK
jgi:hypothetical protein